MLNSEVCRIIHSKLLFMFSSPTTKGFVLSLILLISLPFVLTAQDITGRIISKMDNQPIQGVSLPQLKAFYETEMDNYLEWGIHVMVSQNEAGELTIGDSHEYGNTHDPFDKGFINRMIVDYLQKFASFKDWSIAASWNGIYPKLTNGDTELFFSPEAGVYVLNGLGGAGMTLSFGLAEEVVAGL